MRTQHVEAYTCRRQTGRLHEISWFSRRSVAASGAGNSSLDEYVSDDHARQASPLDLSDPKRWQAELARASKRPPGPRDLALPAFTLLRGGDLFEAPRKPRARTAPELVSRLVDEKLRLSFNGAAEPEQKAALSGLSRVVSGNPAICRRLLLAKPIEVVLIPSGRDYREYGFPPNTNPIASGIFFNDDKAPTALLGLREELVSRKRHLMVHEMTHAVHFLALTKVERESIDKFLMPVYRSRRWVDEAVAIYAEKAFGAVYSEDELDAPGLYGKTRRDWRDRSVFALFMDELLWPERP